MKLTRVHLDGFGTLVEEDFAFGPGLNLVYGPNEAGKSTLQRAILALLYGFYHRDRVTAIEKTAHARYRPWDGSRYGGSLYLTVDNGSSYLLTRRFDTPEPETHLFDAKTGADITDQFVRRRRGFVDFADRLFGMPRPVFEAVVCIRQGQLTDLDDQHAQDIGDAILKLVDSAGTDVSVKSALNRLSAAIRSLGTERSRTGPLARARSAIAEGEVLLEKRTQVIRSLEDDYQRLTELKAQVVAHKAGEQQFRAQLDGYRFNVLSQRLHRLDSILKRKQLLEARLRLEAGSPVPLSSKERDRMLTLSEEARLLRQQVDEIHDEARRVEMSRSASRRALDELELEDRFWLEKEDQRFFDELRTWKARQDEMRLDRGVERELRAQLVQAGMTPNAQRRIQRIDTRRIERLRRIEQAAANRQEDILRFDGEIKTRKRAVIACRAASAGLLTILILAALVFPDSRAPAGKPGSLAAVYEYVVLAIMLFWATAEYMLSAAMSSLRSARASAQQAVQQHYSELHDALGRFGVDKVDQILDIKLRLGEIEQQHADAASRLRAMQKSEAELQPWLERFAADTASQENFDRIAELLEHGRHEWQHIEALNTRIQGLYAEQARKEDQLSSVTEEIGAVLDAAGCSTGQLEADIETYVHAAEAGHEREITQGELSQLRRTEAELLAGSSEKQLRDEVTRLQPATAGRRFEGDSETARRLEAELVVLRADLQKAQIELAALQERISQRESQLPDISAIEEQIETARADAGRLQLTRQALELAHETLIEVAREVHRDFAPKLAALVGRSLANITRGRYHEVYIDPADFTVRIAHGRARTLVSVDHLSFGTRELIALLLRAGIGRIFSASAEKVPLFLDDPLAHSDDSRRRRILSSLLSLSEEQQIVYFTKDRGVAADLDSLQAQYNFIELRQDAQMMPYRWAAGTATQRRDGEDSVRKGKSEKRPDIGPEVSGTSP